MRKTYDIDYRGEKVTATILSDEELKESGRTDGQDVGKYTVELPLRKNKDGNEYYEYIVRDELSPDVFGEAKLGWRFTSLRVGDNDYKFNFWLLDDGTMICNDTTNPQYRKLDQKFYRTATPKTPSEELAKTAFSVIRQVYDLDRIGVPAKEVGQVRKARLATALKLLGFENTSQVNYPVEPGKSYYSLRKLGKLLENYRSLAYVTREINEDGTEDFLVDYVGVPSMEHCVDGTNITMREVEDDEKYMQDFDEWVQTIREIPGVKDFLVDIRESKEKNEPNRLAGYMNIVRRTGQMLLGLNEDLVDPQDLEGVENLTTQQGIDLADKISELIDSESFASACKFEDEWVISECDRVSTLIKEVEGPIGVSTVLATTLLSLYRQLQMSRDERAKLVKEYNRMRNIFDDPNDPEKLRREAKKKQRYDEEVK